MRAMEKKDDKESARWLDLCRFSLAICLETQDFSLSALFSRHGMVGLEIDPADFRGLVMVDTDSNPA